jgi:UDP-N-acetylmuramoyl-tripeptide--D-alanyl-D-alanine ligase
MIQNTKDNVQIQSEMFGDYNASNMLAAFVIGDHFNVPREKMMKSLSSFIPGSNRSELVSYKGCTVIKDAYNANPTSMELALRAFASRFPKGWIILGDMKELGKESLNSHRKIIDVIKELEFQNVALIGKDFKSALLDQQGLFQNLITAEHIDELKTNWDWKVCRGQTLLLKGSRSMNLESLLE